MHSFYNNNNNNNNNNNPDIAKYGQTTGLPFVYP